MTQGNEAPYMHIDEAGPKGRVHIVWEDTIPESGRPFTQSLTAFRSNMDPSRYFVALADFPSDDFDGKRFESTGYVDAKVAAMLSKAFAHIAVELS